MPNTIDLKVEGPFEISVKKNKGIKRIDDEQKTLFWDMDEVSHLKEHQGCYIFALRAGQGCTPWYVGKAGTGKSGEGFEQEVFTDRNLGKYNDVLFNITFGKPVLFFVTRRTRVIPNGVIGEVENSLIKLGYSKNNMIKNIHHANIPKWSINGVIRGGAGQPSREAKKFKNMMGI